MKTKVAREDLIKLSKVLEKTVAATYIMVHQEPQRVLLTFSDNSGKLVTVTLFDAETKLKPTISRQEEL